MHNLLSNIRHVDNTVLMVDVEEKLQEFLYIVVNRSNKKVLLSLKRQNA